jgi:hypothetical protein
MDTARLCDSICCILLGWDQRLLVSPCRREFRRLPFSRTLEEGLANAGDGKAVLHFAPDGTIRGSVEALGGGR